MELKDFSVSFGQLLARLFQTLTGLVKFPRCFICLGHMLCCFMLKCQSYGVVLKHTLYHMITKEFTQHEKLNLRVRKDGVKNA